MVLFAVHATEGIALDQTKDDLRRAYERVFVKTDVDRLKTNPKLYVWNTSILLQSLVVMYEATGEVSYLDRFAEIGKAVLENRADRAGIRDARGNLRRVWLNSVHQNKDFGYLVGTGMVAYPLVRFASIVKSKSELEARFGALSSAIVRDATEAVEAFEHNWDEVEGVYRFSNDDPNAALASKILPINQYLAFARTLIYLDHIVDTTKYETRARRMAMRFKADLAYDSQHDAYTWGYWPEEHNHPEDISHAAIDVGFVAESVKLDQGVFSTTDVKRFANTLEDRVVVDGNIAHDVTGKGEALVPQAVGLWVGLEHLSQKSFDTLLGYYSAVSANDVVPRPHYVLMGIANMLAAL